MITLDEAIIHCEEVAEKNEKDARERFNIFPLTGQRKYCLKCADEHRQLAEWLKDYKRLLEQEPFMNKPCVAHQVCHEDKVKVLNKIKTEINTMPTDYCGGYIGLDKQEVLQVIDKYKAEKEE